MLLELAPKGWTTNDYEVVQNGIQTVNLHQSTFREQGDLVVEGLAYQIRKPDAMRSDFQLWQYGAVIAQATKQGMWKRAFTVTINGEPFEVRAQSAWGRRFLIIHRDQTIGWIEPKGMWSRTVVINMVDFPLPFTMFIAWLVLILWKRDDAAVSAATVTF